MKSLFVSLLSIFALINSSYACYLKQDFTLAQLKAIKNAQAQKTRDWLGRVLKADQKEYQIDIVYSSTLDRYLVILGEFHIKNKKASRAGKELVDQFQYRLFELVPPRETFELGYTDSVDEFVSLQSAIQSMVALSSGRWQESTIFSLAKEGLTFYPYKTLGVYHDNYRLRSSKILSNLEPHNLEPHNLVKNYRLIKDQSTLEYYYINLALEIGPYLKPSNQDSYVIDARDERMATNILFYLYQIVGPKAAIAVVGASHNKGLIKLLSEKDDFIHCPL